MDHAAYCRACHELEMAGIEACVMLRHMVERNELPEWAREMAQRTVERYRSGVEARQAAVDASEAA